MSKWTPTIAIAVIIALALGAFYRLLVLEYEAGDAYPQYSSYRADPLGLLVLHDALASMSGPSPRRSVTPLEHATLSPESTLLLAGSGLSRDEVSTLKHVEEFVSRGGRLVVLFRPHVRKPSFPGETKEKETDRDRGKAKTSGKKNEKGTAQKDRDEAQEEMMETLVPTADVSERWGFSYAFSELATDKKMQIIADAKRSEDAPSTLPQHLPWHSGVGFNTTAPEWKTIYERDALPVVIERKWGEGSIVVASDNYLVTNEAMLNDREPAFLAWLAGAGRQVTFEESHLGVARTAGVMALMQRYRLTPMLLVIALLALVFIWRNAASLVPKQSFRTTGPFRTSHTTVDGIATLLRWSVSRSDLLNACWRMYQSAVPSLGTARQAAVDSVLKEYRMAAPGQRDPVAAFNRITAIINERKPPL